MPTNQFGAKQVSGCCAQLRCQGLAFSLLLQTQCVARTEQSIWGETGRWTHAGPGWCAPSRSRWFRSMRAFYQGTVHCQIPWQSYVAQRNNSSLTSSANHFGPSRPVHSTRTLTLCTAMQISKKRTNIPKPKTRNLGRWNGNWN